MKHRNKDFFKRLNFLNSEENTDEIIWSCSSSSDNENDSVMNNVFKQKLPKTKKRKVNKKILTNSICNLDVTISDASQEKRETYATSPILKPRLSKTTSNCKGNSSPLVIESQNSISPILISRTDEPRIFALQSKENRQIVCKKLFNENIMKKSCISPIVYKKGSECLTLIKKESEETPELSVNSIPNKTELVANIKSYFRRSFSTESLSQNSISEYSTPKNSSKASDEVEIIDFTQALPLQIKQEISPIKTDIFVKSKQIKYKKDGLAYRLDNLLKKQNANISLWHHEQFLANNSNFILPKGAYVAFRIKQISLKFGCFLILAMSEKDEVFIILINNLFVKGKLICDGILKVYEPYKVLDFSNNCKLIVNVCKYICESFNFQI